MLIDLYTAHSILTSLSLSRFYINGHYQVIQKCMLYLHICHRIYKWIYQIRCGMHTNNNISYVFSLVEVETNLCLRFGQWNLVRNVCFSCDLESMRFYEVGNRIGYWIGCSMVAIGHGLIMRVFHLQFVSVLVIKFENMIVDFWLFDINFKSWIFEFPNHMNKFPLQNGSICKIRNHQQSKLQILNASLRWNLFEINSYFEKK